MRLFTTSFRNYYTTTGKLAVEIYDTNLNFYDYKGSGARVGSLQSVRRNLSGVTGIALCTYAGSVLYLGYREDNESPVQAMMSFDTRDTTKTPWIKNTANGTLFDDNPNGGITIENGLIKEWHLKASNGEIEINEPNNHKTIITVANGLIVNWEYQ